MACGPMGMPSFQAPISVYTGFKATYFSVLRGPRGKCPHTPEPAGGPHGSATFSGMTALKLPSQLQVHVTVCWLILWRSAQSFRTNLDGTHTSGSALASLWLGWNLESHFAVAQNWNWTTCLRQLALHTQMSITKHSCKTNLMLSSGS